MNRPPSCPMLATTSILALFTPRPFMIFGSDIINNCTFAYKWIWTNTRFEMYYKFAKISGVLFYKITLKLYNVLMIYLLQIHLSVGQSLTELATPPAPRLTDIPMTRAAIYIFIYTVHSMYHLQYRHTYVQWCILRLVTLYIVCTTYNTYIRTMMHFVYM